MLLILKRNFSLIIIKQREKLYSQGCERHIIWEEQLQANCLQVLMYEYTGIDELQLSCRGCGS